MMKEREEGKEQREQRKVKEIKEKILKGTAIEKRAKILIVFRLISSAGASLLLNAWIAGNAVK